MADDQENTVPEGLQDAAARRDVLLPALPVKAAAAAVMVASADAAAAAEARPLRWSIE